MLYYIPFHYKALNAPTASTVDARLIVDLPQTTLAEAQRNLLVYDLVRFAYVRNCYLQDAAYLAKPESILQIYNGSMPTNLPQMKVVYQREPNGSSWYEFFFYIHLDNRGDTAFLPFQQIIFTCRNEYAIYYEAFLSDLLVCGIPMQAPQYEEGNLVKVCYGAIYELAIIEKDANGQLVAVPIGNKQSSIPINQLTNSCIHGFDLTTEIMQILGASWQTAGYNLGGGWFELILADAQQSKSVVLHIIRQEMQGAFHFYLVIDQDAEPYYRLEEFRGFDDMQRLIKKIYGHIYKPSTKAQFEIEALLRKSHSEVLMLMDLHDFIASFNPGDDVELIIKGIMQKYQINYHEAEYYYNVSQIGR